MTGLLLLLWTLWAGALLVLAVQGPMPVGVTPPWWAVTALQCCSVLLLLLLFAAVNMQPHLRRLPPAAARALQGAALFAAPWLVAPLLGWHHGLWQWLLQATTTSLGRLALLFLLLVGLLLADCLCTAWVKRAVALTRQAAAK